MLLVKADLAGPDAVAGMEMAWPHVVVASAAVAYADLPDAGSPLVQASAERDSQGCGAGRRVGVAHDCQGAGCCRRARQNPADHRLIAFRPAPVRAGYLVEQGRPGLPCPGASAQDHQVSGGEAAVAQPQHRVIGEQSPGQEGADRRAAASADGSIISFRSVTSNPAAARSSASSEATCGMPQDFTDFPGLPAGCPCSGSYGESVATYALFGMLSLIAVKTVPSRARILADNLDYRRSSATRCRSRGRSPQACAARAAA
jgi:hypothetical protein